MQNDNKRWPWISLGVGVLGLGFTTFLVYRHYRLGAQRKRETCDPRAQQVRALIEEAEHLISLGRRGGRESQ